MPRTTLPITNGFYESDSLPISSQNCVNLYPVIEDVEALSPETLCATPGVEWIVTNGITGATYEGGGVVGGGGGTDGTETQGGVDNGGGGDNPDAGGTDVGEGGDPILIDERAVCQSYACSALDDTVSGDYADLTWVEKPDNPADGGFPFDTGVYQLVAPDPSAYTNGNNAVEYPAIDACDGTREWVFKSLDSGLSTPEFSIDNDIDSETPVAESLHFAAIVTGGNLIDSPDFLPSGDIFTPGIMDYKIPNFTSPTTLSIACGLSNDGNNERWRIRVNHLEFTDVGDTPNSVTTNSDWIDNFPAEALIDRWVGISFDWYFLGSGSTQYQLNPSLSRWSNWFEQRLVTKVFWLNIETNEIESTTFTLEGRVHFGPNTQENTGALQPRATQNFFFMNGDGLASMVKTASSPIDIESIYVGWLRNQTGYTPPDDCVFV